MAHFDSNLRTPESPLVAKEPPHPEAFSKGLNLNNPIPIQSEWLVSDSQGAFAMGTASGIRTRKYHGFYMGTAGRWETAYLVDLEILCNGISVWPHQYQSPTGPIICPRLDLGTMSFQNTVHGPLWEWILADGRLSLQIQSCYPAGIELQFQWESQTRRKAELCVRGLWGMRNLHAVGGMPWEWKMENPTHGAVLVQGTPEVHVWLKGAWQWREEPLWYENFHYSTELERGYLPDENLFSMGVLQTTLGSRKKCSWILTKQPLIIQLATSKKKDPVDDFVLNSPAGVVAGFPWFGEWGRDTFISLPGIAIHTKNAVWAKEILSRWGQWIYERGMLPNVLGKETPQWDSADATLWWCHSLAALWAFALVPQSVFNDLEPDYLPILERAIGSIQSGRHKFLNPLENGLLEVTEPYATWMDARVGGQAVTPRMGVLPEINSLWFQARCLHWILSGKGDFSEIEKLGNQVLQIQEPERPNAIFLHSLPLAPSFVLHNVDALERDVISIAENFWTPVGLRTLHPKHSDYCPQYLGNHEQRDRSYHQGPVWGWLGGHFEMAAQRLSRRFKALVGKTFSDGVLDRMPISGHIPELFDAEPPFHPRGAPAQAWSLACFEESKARKKHRVDLLLKKVLSGRNN